MERIGNLVNSLSSSPSSSGSPQDEGRAQTPFKNIKVDLKSKAFQRKPRSLIFNALNPALGDLMATTSLDCKVQFWNLAERKPLNCPLLGEEHSVIPEDLVWNTGHNSLALGFSSNSEESSNKQLSLMVNIRMKPDQVLFSSVDIPLRPHNRKGVSVLCSVNSLGNSFVSGGFDKKMVLTC